MLYAIGIRHVGETVAKKLATHFKSIENLINANFDDLILVDEIDKIADSLVDFFKDPCNMKMIDKLKIGLNFKSEIINKRVSSVLSNKSFVISGVFKIILDALKGLLRLTEEKLFLLFLQKQTF